MYVSVHQLELLPNSHGFRKLLKYETWTTKCSETPFKLKAKVARKLVFCCISIACSEVSRQQVSTTEKIIKSQYYNNIYIPVFINELAFETLVNTEALQCQK